MGYVGSVRLHITIQRRDEACGKLEVWKSKSHDDVKSGEGLELQVVTWQQAWQATSTFNVIFDNRLEI